ncbi:hypothetical protein Tco_1342018, partial [Tanacetum coccineum]
TQIPDAVDTSCYCKVQKLNPQAEPSWDQVLRTDLGTTKVCVAVLEGNVHDLGYEGFQMECQSARKNVMAHEQDLRAKLLKHKGTHNVKTDIKSHTVVIEGTIDSE